MDGGMGLAGESMSVVIEKRLSELQEDYDKMKSTWIDPEEFSKVRQQLEAESEAKHTLEVTVLALSFCPLLFSIRQQTNLLGEVGAGRRSYRVQQNSTPIQSY